MSLGTVQEAALIEEIRILTAAELPMVAKCLPFDHTAPGRHAEYFAMQQAGDTVCLIAWHGPLPVGHLMMRWEGARRLPFLSITLRNCPHISAVLVEIDHRSQGIGTRLVAAAEGLARSRGYQRVGLSVSLSNDRARALYERLGYRDAGFGTQVRRWEWCDQSGVRHFEQESGTYLVKPLQRLFPKTASRQPTK